MWCVLPDANPIQMVYDKSLDLDTVALEETNDV
jgi:hypothetical protein